MKKKIAKALLFTGLICMIGSTAACGIPVKKLVEKALSQDSTTSQDTGKKNTGQSTTEKINEPKETQFSITPTENAIISYTTYTTPEGYFTFEIPEGWEVETKVVDIFAYQIRVYDPDCPTRIMYFCPTLTSYRSFEAVELANQFSGEVDMSSTPVNPEVTPSSLFATSGHTFGYSDFTEIAKLGTNDWGGETLQATCMYQGEKLEGIFSANSMFVMEMNYFGTDVGCNLEEGVLMMLAPEEEFVSWQPVLGHIFASMVIDQSYMEARQEAWNQMLGTSQQLAAAAEYSSDLIMAGWEARNNTYDIISQRTSDATLGRDRVYDTETGEVYYTSVGWYDSYDGSRLEYVEEGSSYYNLPVTGTID